MKKLKNPENLEKLTELGEELARTQLIAKNWGNLSCRVGDSFYITPTGCFCSYINPKELIKIDIASGAYDKNKNPSFEREMHRMIYQLLNSVNFIAHTHQTWAGALSASGLSKLDISLEARTSIVGKTIPIIDYALPRTKKFAKNFADTYKKQSISNLAVIAHKGGLFFADSEKEIASLAQDLEIEVQKFLVNIIKSKYPKLEVTLANLTDTLLDVYISKRHWLFSNKEQHQVGFLQELEYLLEDLNLEFSIQKDPIYRVFSNSVVYPALDDFAQFIGTKIKPSNYKNLSNKINKIQSNKNLKKPNSSLVFSLKNKGFIILSSSKKAKFMVENVLEKNLIALLVADLFNYHGALTRLESFLLRKNFIYLYSKKIHTKN